MDATVIAAPPRGLNPDQAAAVAHVDGPLRIMAGAGTGKTHTLTARIVALIEGGHARPSQILALTFTNKATEELTERIGRAVAAIPGAGDERVDIDTYNAFGGRVVAEHANRLDLPPDPLILTPAEAWILLWRALDEVEFRSIDLTYLRGGPGGSPLKAMLGLGSRLRDELRDLTDLQSLLDVPEPDEETAKLRDYAAALAVYERKKRAAGAIDYGDQIALACQVLALPDIAALYRQRYRYLLVDEFQDTNYAQSVLVQRLIGDSAGNICVVGDPNQAIYGFRGAAPDNIERFSEIEFPTARTVSLRQNFRSTQAILDVANAIWVDDPGPHRGGLVAATSNAGVTPKLVEGATQEDEIAFLADEIRRLHGAGVAYNEIAIIARKNAMKTAVLRGLRERRIPAEAVGGSSLFETPEVRELVSYLRAIGNPADDPSLAHVFCAERWGLDEAALYLIASDRQRDETLLMSAHRMVAEGTAPAGLSECLLAIDRLAMRAYRIGLARLVDEIIALRAGGYDALETANVQRFAEFVRAFAESRVDRPDLADLNAYLDLLLAAGPDDEAAEPADLGESDTVKIMTSHASKGLEWPVVFVVGANERDFVTANKKEVLPADLAQSGADRPRRNEFEEGPAGDKLYQKAFDEWRKEQHKLEELRVLYVALTRARERLYITWSKTHPTRKKDAKLLPALKDAAQLCEYVTAPAASEAPPTIPAFREIAPRLLAAAGPYLNDAGLDPAATSALVESMTSRWNAAGGDPAVPAAAVARYLADRDTLLEQLSLIRAVERRQQAEVEAGTFRDVISYSQLETHRACAHRYHLKYDLGMPGRPDRRAASIGTAFHNAIAIEAQRRRAGLPIPAEQTRAIFEQDPAHRSQPAVESVEPTVTDLAASTPIDPIAAYLASPDATVAEPLLIEEAFSLKLGHATLRGVIDRVQRLPDGSVEVVDYKTDRHPRSEAEVRAGLQLPIYLLACRSVFPEITPSPTRAVMFFVRSNQRVAVEYSETELAEIRATLESEVAALRAVAPDAHSASPTTCRFCDYRSVCKFKM